MSIDIIFTKTDESGNKLTCINGNLSLKLSSESRCRDIGNIFPHPNGLGLVYVKHESESDVFRKTDAWSLNYNVIREVKFIMIVTPRKIYKIFAAEALEKGSFLWFKTSGYERKIYVPRNLWFQKPNNSV